MSNWRHLDRACEGDERYPICLDHNTALPIILHDNCRRCRIGSILTGARGRRKLFKVCRKHNTAFPLAPRDESRRCRIGDISTGRTRATKAMIEYVLMTTIFSLMLMYQSLLVMPITASNPGLIDTLLSGLIVRSYPSSI